MTTKILPNLDLSNIGPVGKGGIASYIETNGRMPPITLQITPIDPSKNSFLIDRFLTYQFSSSMLIPVDQFSFSFLAPDQREPLNQLVKEGDIVTLYGNGIALATGIIDQTDVEVDSSFGERWMLNGRTFVGQLEDQDAVSFQNDPVWGNSMTLKQAATVMISSTRIPGVLVQDGPSRPYLFATSPGETKISALQRFVEPLNCLIWSSPTGQLMVGRPNMSQKSKGFILCSKNRRLSNVLSIKCVRASAGIPNIITPVWSGQESVQTRVTKEQSLPNNAVGPKRLYGFQHYVPKTVVISNPQGADPQDLSKVNDLSISASTAAPGGTIAGGSNILQAYAKREMARHNQKEIIVQCVVPGHYDENGDPWKIDSVYTVQYDRGDLDKDMYLYQVEYMGGEDKGQTTSLYFCNLNTIVSDIRAP
jgi:prophage tail gpP-like protein